MSHPWRLEIVSPLKIGYWRLSHHWRLEIVDYLATGDWRLEIVNYLATGDWRLEIVSPLEIGDWRLFCHWRLEIVLPLEIGEYRIVNIPLEIDARCVGGPTLKIRDCLTTPMFRNPVAISIESTGIEKKDQQVARSSEVRSIWKNRQHTISYDYILELTFCTTNGGVN